MEKSPVRGHMHRDSLMSGLSSGFKSQRSFRASFGGNPLARKNSIMLSQSSTKKLQLQGFGSSLPKADAEQPPIDFIMMCGSCKSIGSLSVYDKRCMMCMKENPYFQQISKSKCCENKYWYCTNLECESVNILPATECRNCFLLCDQAVKLKETNNK